MAHDLSTIDPAALEAVTGGRYTAGPEVIKPELIQGIGELAKAVTAVGQNLAAVKQESESQKLQLLQQLVQQRAGGAR